MTKQSQEKPRLHLAGLFDPGHQRPPDAVGLYSRSRSIATSGVSAGGIG
jgi:hypothetical protein